MTERTNKPTDPGSDPFGTELITKLANDLFSESAGDSSLHSISPMGRATPTSLSHGAEGERLSSTIPTGAPRYSGLAGGYPSATPDTHPPVHPGSQGWPPPPATGSGTGSGGHDPSSGEAYPFGEPRCNGLDDTQNHASSSPQQRREQGSGTNPYWAQSSDPEFSRGGYENPFTPDFYFLRGSERASAGAYSAVPVPTHAFSPSSFTIDAVRRDFPVLHQRVNGHPLIWFDNAATTQKPQSVIDATSRFYGEDNSNIHRAAHALAARSTELYEGGRDKVRQFIGAADTKEIVFVRGTTEAINLVAQTYGRTHIRQGDEILLTTMEHHANIVPWQILSQQTGAVLRVVPINDAGELILEAFTALLGPRTKLVAVTHVSNALGTINPIEIITKLAHAQGVPVLVDGAQSIPHMPINVQALDCDFFVFSGHKIFGPTGIGVLYGKSALLEGMPPYQGGGNMIRDVTFDHTTYQDIPQKFEAGTPDIAGVVGLGAAVDYLTSIGMPAIAAYEHELLEYATLALASVPGIRPIGTAAAKASVLSFVINGIQNEQIGRHLDRYGIAVRSGHHCAQPTMRRFGEEGTVRPSLAFYNTREEIDVLIRALHALPRQ
ncbi:MAG TPA: cysteine desulfurase [Nitrospira sp.]|nr:cysteine desulfurase [Nitrospira sp.]